jgi:hypothetical protein
MAIIYTIDIKLQKTDKIAVNVHSKQIRSVGKPQDITFLTKHPQFKQIELIAKEKNTIIRPKF